LLKELWSTGTGCPGKCWSHHLWSCSKNLYIYHFRTWFSRHGDDGLTTGLYDLRGHFQP